MTVALAVAAAGAVAVAIALARLTRNGGPGTVVLGPLEGEHGFVFATSPAKRVLALGVTATVTAALAVLAAEGTWWLWPVVALLALRMVLFARGGSEPRFGITPSAVVLEGVRRLPWEAITAVDVADPLKRGRVRLVRVRAADTVLIVPPTTFVAGPQFVAATVDAYRADPARRAHIGAPSELERIAA